jgi:hypothetical protein
MLTIVDLHQEEELSSSSMGKVVGGVDVDGAEVRNDFLNSVNALYGPEPPEPPPSPPYGWGPPGPRPI